MTELKNRDMLKEKGNYMNTELKIEYMPIDSLEPYEGNAKLHPAEQIEQIKKSIQDYGFRDPVGVWRGTIVEGHGRILAAKELGLAKVPVINLDDMSDEQRREYALVHNQTTMSSGFDFVTLDEELANLPDFDAEFYGFAIDADFDSATNLEHSSLSDSFIVPPFSVLDTRQGYWQDRKKAWKSIGIKSENGRDAECMQKSFGEKYGRKQQTGTSIFDPVLCEIVYKWFCTNGGKIYDCFAGGSVRGIVASKLGYEYHGIDLRQDQIDANEENAAEVGVSPNWYCDDSLNADKYIQDNSCDLVFSCPPYADLEVYSDDPRDISNMGYAEFCQTYRKIIDIACKKLKQNRFAVFVVGDIRDKKGFYRNFVDYTKECFNENGLHTYNEIILIDMLGTAMLRASSQFKNRKVVKTHQNVLVFYKGDPARIKENYGKIEIDESVFADYIVE